MQSAIHMNGATPFTSMEAFTVNTNAFMMNTHMSASMPLIWRAKDEMDQDCPHVAGDNYWIWTGDCDWHHPAGRFKTHDLRMEAYFRSEQDRDLLVHFLEEAVERYCQAVVERSQHDGSTTVASVA